MTTLQRALDYLDREPIRYLHTCHAHADTAREVASAEHIPPYRLAKTVVFYSELGYGMAVVPADEFVDFEQLRRLMGCTKIRLATEEELAELFPESELGAMPPFGSLFQLSVFVDHDVAAQRNIAFNAGTHRDVIHMNVDDFLRLMNPVLGDFAMRAQSIGGF